MEFSKAQRDKICEEYINSNVKRKDICAKYNLNYDTFKTWLNRYYPNCVKSHLSTKKEYNLLEGSTYSEMSNNELQIELIKKDIELERLKKNYSVQINNMGEKEYTTFSKKTLK